MSKVPQNGRSGLYSSKKSHSLISLKDRPESFSILLSRFGKEKSRKRFFLPKVGLIPHFVERQP